MSRSPGGLGGGLGGLCEQVSDWAALAPPLEKAWNVTRSHGRRRARRVPYPLAALVGQCPVATAEHSLT